MNRRNLITVIVMCVLTGLCGEAARANEAFPGTRQHFHGFTMFHDAETRAAGRDAENRRHGSALGVAGTLLGP